MLHKIMRKIESYTGIYFYCQDWEYNTHITHPIGSVCGPTKYYKPAHLFLTKERHGNYWKKHFMEYWNNIWLYHVVDSYHINLTFITLNLLFDGSSAFERLFLSNIVEFFGYLPAFTIISLNTLKLHLITLPTNDTKMHILYQMIHKHTLNTEFIYDNSIQRHIDVYCEFDKQPYINLLLYKYTISNRIELLIYQIMVKKYLYIKLYSSEGSNHGLEVKVFDGIGINGNDFTFETIDSIHLKSYTGIIVVYKLSLQVRNCPLVGYPCYLIFVGALIFEFVAPLLDQILTTPEQLCKVP